LKNEIIAVFPQHPSTQDNQRIKAQLHAAPNVIINPQATVTEHHISGLRGRGESNSLEEKRHLPGRWSLLLDHIKGSGSGVEGPS